jgi:hypothetical protein
MTKLRNQMKRLTQLILPEFQVRPLCKNHGTVALCQNDRRVAVLSLSERTIWVVIDCFMTGDESADVNHLVKLFEEYCAGEWRAIGFGEFEYQAMRPSDTGGVRGLHVHTWMPMFGIWHVRFTLLAVTALQRFVVFDPTILNQINTGRTAKEETQ